MENKFEIDEILYQKLVGFFIDIYHLPPLSAKIYAYLTFDFCNAGVTFDELIDILKASKSSISSNLNLLQSNGYIIAINKIDERKRFFIINPDYVTIRFDGLIEKLEKEKDIVNDIRKFRSEKCTKGDSTLYNEKVNIYISLLEKNIENFTKTLQKLKQ